jgi:thiosulfate/3-mercaptopyruvate sulfurtransferase
LRVFISAKDKTYHSPNGRGFMRSRRRFGSALRFVKRRALAVLIVCGALLPWAQGQTGQSSVSEALPATQLVQPADLVRELASASADARPTIVYVGFRTLFAGGHIPGATFHGSASTEQGLADIKKWAASLPRATNLVIYCGCCPFERCPNIRPAFALFRDMGFTHLRVLELPTSFAADWASKNYAIEKGLN